MSMRIHASATFIVVWVSILLAIVAVVVFSWYSAKKRRDAMRESAARVGFTRIGKDPDLLRRFGALGDPFDRGFARRATNVLVGSWRTRPAIAWDYTYKTRGRQKYAITTNHHLGIVSVQAGLLMPRLSVLPDGLVSTDIGALLGDDIQVDVSQVGDQFNRVFTVSSAQPGFARDLLDPAMTEFLLFHPHEGFTIDGSQLVRISAGHLEPENLAPALEYLGAILDRIPDRLRRTLGATEQG